MKEKILITGFNGEIGSKTLKELVKRGKSIIAMDINDAKEQKIQAIESTIEYTKKRIIKLQYQLDDELLNSNDNNESDKIKSLKDQVSINEVFINKKIDEQEEIKKSYTEYIERFKKLKGYK